MQLSLFLTTLSWLMIAIDAELENTCPRPELLQPCRCDTKFVDSVKCVNITQPFDLRTVFGRLSGELPKHKITRLLIENSSAIESIEFNSTGSTSFAWVYISSLENLVKIHEGAFAGGAEQQILLLYINLELENKIQPPKWQPNQPSPYNWLGLINRLKSLVNLFIITRGSNFHVPANAFNRLDELSEVAIKTKDGRVTIDERAFAGSKLSIVLLSPVNRVPAEIVADLSPEIAIRKDATYYMTRIPFRLRLVIGKINESSFDPRAFVRCSQRPVHLELNQNPIQTLPESVFRSFFDGHPDNLVNVGETRIDSRTAANAWWANNDKYKMMVVNFTYEELKELRGSALPIEKLGRFNKYKLEPKA